jgi:hypothetical protein
MSLFRIIEGFISTREKKKLGYYAFDNTVAAGTDVLYDFGALRKDVTLETNKTIRIKFDSTSNPAFSVDAGIWKWGEQYSEKMYITTTVATQLAILANG